ncbi:MAG TPA: PAS domain-containing protein [Ferrovibrio sp.]|uniref:PAS domain-containing protein n=1 Tax=Ferrovibrio sp. TaxID=1917215 RepID=UPI002ED1247A
MNQQIVNSRFRFDPDLRFERPELQSLLELWHGKRNGRRVPDRADFSPFVLRPYLSRVMIYEVVEGAPRRFRIRLYGTLISHYSGRDATGRFIDEIMAAEAHEDFDTGLSWVLEHRKPLRILGTYYFVDRSFLHFESVALPLTVGAAEIEQLLTVTYFADEA